MSTVTKQIRLAGSLFLTYLAPKANRHKEALLKVNIAVIVAIRGGNKNGVRKPKTGAVHSAWHSTKTPMHYWDMDEPENLWP